MEKVYLTTRSFASDKPDGGKLSLNPNEVESVWTNRYGSKIIMKSGAIHFVMETMEQVEKYMKTSLLPLDFSV